MFRSLARFFQDYWRLMRGIPLTIDRCPTCGGYCGQCGTQSHNLNSEAKQHG